MEWSECPLSQHLKAEGDKGQYWIMEEAYIYLERVTPSPAGIDIEKLGNFYDIDDAKRAAGIIDKQIEIEV